MTALSVNILATSFHPTGIPNCMRKAAASFCLVSTPTSPFLTMNSQGLTPFLPGYKGPLTLRQTKDETVTQHDGNVRALTPYDGVSFQMVIFVCRRAHPPTLPNQPSIHPEGQESRMICWAGFHYENSNPKWTIFILGESLT